MSAGSTRTPEWHSAYDIVQRNVRLYRELDLGVEQSLVNGRDMRVLGLAMGQHAVSHGIQHSAFGGRGPYAGALAESAAMMSDTDMRWFAVRYTPKDRGTGQMIEGARISGDRVTIVEPTGRLDDLLAVCRDAANEELSGAHIAGVLPLVELDEGVREQIASTFPDATYAPLFSRGDFEIN